MEILVILLIVVASLLAVAYPVVNARRFAFAYTGEASEGPSDDLFSARDAVFDALRDLQFEHATGKLSDHDYEQLRARYDVKAATILQQIDALEPRAKKRAANLVNGKKVCPSCQSETNAANHFCTRCGAKLA